MYIQDRIMKIANDIELSYKISSITENKRLTSAIARVYVDNKKHDVEIELSPLFFNRITREGQDRVLKHELMHVKHSEITGKQSNHSKEFKDLCYKFFGDRTIGNTTIDKKYIISIDN